MKCLVTAIGSMSSDCVISNLKKNGMYVAGCDIYPGEWHSVTTKCDSFHQVPLVSQEKEYMAVISGICKTESINYIFPLTDIEVDFFNIHKASFESLGIRICIPSSKALNYARDKYNLYCLFKDSANIPSVKTWLYGENFVFPCIAKPKNGRSSEGLMKIDYPDQMSDNVNWDNYIFQEYIKGDIYTVDLVRSHAEDKLACVSRIELLRTKNGAGTTVRMIHDAALDSLVKDIADTIQIEGCVNMEFIKSDNKYYLIDINPRFSAGVAFSHMAGYNMVMNHLKVFTNKKIDDAIICKEQILTKKYVEEILKEYE
ncbi:MAG: ATP-grasp domain-containing protein [Bacteroidales bacterium]